MAEKMGDFLVKRMNEWGVKRVFGYTGDGINGVMGAFDRSSDKIDFVQVPHEEMAAFMATAYAKFSGEVGVCVSTSGPGAIHMLTGLYDAKLDHQPVVAIVGQQATFSIGSTYQQEIDLHTALKDVASDYIETITTPAQARHVIDRAFRIAIANRTVTAIILPRDVQEMEAIEEPPREHGVVYSGVGYSEPRVVPVESDLKRAAEVLNAGKKVAIMVGAGALGATDEVIQVAEKLGAGVAKAFLGKAALPDDLPYVTGAIGFFGTSASWDLMMNCDTFFMVGSGFPYAEYLPKPGQARGVQIDIDAKMLGIRYPMEVNLLGDTKETLQALLPLLQVKTDNSWRQQVEQSVQKSWSTLEQRAMETANPLNPQRVFWELSSRLPDNTIITTDSGTAAAWVARDIKAKRGMMISVSGGLASMGSAMPYALAAKIAHPDRLVVATVGDGAMQMNGLNMLISVAKYWKEWSDPRLVVVILNNRDLNFVTWEQRLMDGNRKFHDSQSIPDFPYAQYAELLGLRGIKVESPEATISAIEAAMQSDRPLVIEAYTDANVPMLPPHVLPEQAKKYATAVSQGDEDTLAIIEQTSKQDPGLAETLRQAAKK